MIARILKHLKTIELIFAIINAIFVILSIVYFPLLLSSVISAGVWYLVIACVVLSIDVSGLVGAICVKAINKY